MAGYIGSKASVVSSGAERKKTFTITGSTTSLTGLNYTVGKVHVFQNGVRLVDGTDYTATNGTTITLTVAAQSGDNVVVISQASYQVALSGIDDQSNATALTIDSDENVMVGVASVQTQSGTTAGTSLYGGSNAGLITAGRNGDVLRLNRQSSDGTILDLRKDGTSVGSIGSVSGVDLFVAGSRGAGQRYLLNNILPCNASGDVVDNTIDFGQSNYRYKDAYLSGGIYLGGAVAANKLEDYEEGTFTPSFYFSSGSVTYTVQHGFYTKVGRQVTINANIFVNTISSPSGALEITGLPFNIVTNVGERGVTSASVGLVRALANSYPSMKAYVATSNRIVFAYNNTNQGHLSLDATNLTAGCGIYVTATYHTDA